ncbi:hypothetical protein K493DRAFT_334631 [Basidiobolus meristosporus CBS 931.73]|uniref:Uncharacterized protein n=1 Tax=Basidiobolus meristosporus CBS 931.73 TaxID=1314790 RepID=A0A1Y1YWK0_9FUNG|nr:hypothetical protein K493DRAFT_334631 [Basidiobolus meristosporus CBS 931.73]|eukprot:ORY02410.1 hypothetical protein K493DRAFT_334631 [Basidiobolus meristosporus CBS 931.73]
MYSHFIGTTLLLACSILSVSAGTAHIVELDGGKVYKIKGSHGDCVNIRNMILVYAARVSEDPIGFTVHSGPNCTPDTKVQCVDRTTPNYIFGAPQNGQSIGFFDDGSTTNSAALTCALSGDNPFGGAARDDSGKIISDNEKSSGGSYDSGGGGDGSGGNYDSGGDGYSSGGGSFGSSGSFGNSGSLYGGGGGGGGGGGHYGRNHGGHHGYRSGGFGSSGSLVG